MNRFSFSLAAAIALALAMPASFAAGPAVPGARIVAQDRSDLAPARLPADRIGGLGAADR